MIEFTQQINVKVDQYNTPSGDKVWIFILNSPDGHFITSMGLEEFTLSGFQLPEGIQ